MPGVLIVSERALPGRGGLAVATSRIAKQAAARGEREAAALEVVALQREALARAADARAVE